MPRDWNVGSLSPYAKTPLDIAREMIKMLELEPGQTMYDLGCGTGDVLILGAEEFMLRGVGFEIIEDRAAFAMENVKRRGLQDRVTIIHDDFTKRKYWSYLNPKPLSEYAIRNADGLFLYLTTRGTSWLKPKLEKELRKGTRVVSYVYRISGWKPISPRRDFYLYEIR